MSNCPRPPEPPPASTDPGVCSPSFLNHPFWEPTIKGLTVLMLIVAVSFILFGFTPMLMKAADETWWLTALSSLFIPTGILVLLLLGFVTGKIMERLGV